MSRVLCLAVLLGGLVSAPGCSSCFGGLNGCRRPSFMEFRAPCRGQADPCHAPACEPACSPAPVGECCEPGGGGTVLPAPAGGERVGTFS
jgi:hypothetical protein